MLELDGNEAMMPYSTGLNALVRIGQHYGLTIEPQQLTRAHPFDGAEPAPPILLKMAETSGLTGRIVQFRPGELAKLARLVPALLLLSDGKVAILESVQRRDGACFALIHDLEAAGGVSALVDEHRLSEIWDGGVMLLKRRWRWGDQEQPFGFKWLVGQLVIERKLFRDIAVAALLLSILALAPIVTIIVLLDRVLDARSYQTLYVMAAAIVVIVVFDTLFGYLRRHLVITATTRIDARINLHVYDKLLNLPMSFFEKNATGTIGSKLAQIWHIRDFLSGEVFGTLVDCIMLLVLLPALFALNWKLAWMVVALSFVMMGVYAVFLPALRVKHRAVSAAEHRMGAQQIETIYGIRTVKSLSLEGLKRYQRDLRVADVVEAHQDFERLANIPQTLVNPLEKMIYMGSFFLGCYMVLNDPTGGSAGTVMAFGMLAARVTGPIVAIAGMLNAFEYARGAVGEVGSVLNIPPEEGRSGTGLKLPIRGRIVFQDVRFRYSPTTPYALDGVSFDLPQGTIFGVMGRSGSGKTTLTRLLQGLNRDYEGLIKIDGMDLREIDLDHLRTNIGVVPQENFLFTGTIRDNISAARPNASFDKIIRAAQLAGAEEFIERMARGYETPVEEGAVNFSGGQRQRLAIARALLVDPPILILDEATSALDAESEAIVSSNLMRIAADRTVIIISHRLSSLTMADAILVLERGKFYDMGRHDELLVRCDIYKSLWFQQNRHLDADGRHARIAFRPTPVA